MKPLPKKWRFFLGLLLAAHTGLAEEVSPEERIREFQKPRGLSSSSGSKSSSQSSSPSSSSNSSTSNSDPYAAMGKSFSDQMTANSKANEEIQKLIPKAEAEPDYLKSFTSAAKGGGTNSNITATLSQITAATINTIGTLAQMQIEMEKAKAEEELAALRKKQSLLRQQEIQEQTEGLSPIAIALGALNKTGADSTPSPVSIRTKISSEPGHSRGLFPSTLNDLSARAYNAP